MHISGGFVMSSNINITTNMINNTKKNKHKRYLLVASNLYGDEYISPTATDTAIQKLAEKRSKMFLPQIDIITSTSVDAEDLLTKNELYDYKAPTIVSVQYHSHGEIKELPVMYNDEVLNSIASQQTNNKLVKSSITDDVFQNVKDKLIANENDLLNRLLYSQFEITDPQIRMALASALRHGTSQINFDQLYSRIHQYYKQWRTFYYHTSGHYQKDIAIKRKKM